MADVRGGRGRGRGGPNRGRGGKATTGGAQGVPLAAQMKQLQRLDEPKEMAIFRRFDKLGLVSVESVYGRTGLLQTNLRIPSSEFKASWGLNPAPGVATSILTLVQGEQVLRNIEAQEARERALSRRALRLGAADAALAWDDMSQDQKELLLLSNQEYRRRYPNGAPGAQGAGGGTGNV
jgi:hypothetical protein